MGNGTTSDRKAIEIDLDFEKLFELELGRKSSDAKMVIHNEEFDPTDSENAWYFDHDGDMAIKDKHDNCMYILFSRIVKHRDILDEATINTIRSTTSVLGFGKTALFKLNRFDQFVTEFNEWKSIRSL